MSKRHLKNISAPRAWPIERKKKIWIAKPNPGPHSLKESMPLSVIFTDLIKYTKNKRELRKILNRGIVMVNGKIRKDIKFPVGLFDVIEFPEDEYYRLLYNKKGKFYLKSINKKEKNILPYKIEGRKILKKNTTQLNFSNGENILTDIKDIKIGDTVLLDGNKIKEVLRLDKGSCIYLTAGSHIGAVGNIEKFDRDKIIFTNGKDKYETLRKYCFVIGKDKPIISINEK